MTTRLMWQRELLSNEFSWISAIGYIKIVGKSKSAEYFIVLYVMMVFPIVLWKKYTIGRITLFLENKQALSWIVMLKLFALFFYHDSMHLFGQIWSGFKSVIISSIYCTIFAALPGLPVAGRILNSSPWQGVKTSGVAVLLLLSSLSPPPQQSINKAMIKLLRNTYK